MALFAFQGQDEHSKPALWFVQALHKQDAEDRINAVRPVSTGPLCLIPVEVHGSEVLVMRIAKGEVVAQVRTPDLAHALV